MSRNETVEPSLSSKQAKFLACLLTEPTIDGAARQAQVARATAFRWMQEPLFRAALREARRGAVSQATGRLQVACADAVDALRSIVNDPKAPAMARVQSAKAILESSMKGLELDDISARLEELETGMQLMYEAAERPDLRIG